MKTTWFEHVLLDDLRSQGAALQADPQVPLVMVVDDEKVIADTLTAILKFNGMDVVTAYDGLSALELARTAAPDLLLTDVMMPGLNGIELAIGMTRMMPKCKVIMISGQAATLELFSLPHVQECDFTLLQKPIHPRQLLEYIRQTLAPAPRSVGREFGVPSMMAQPLLA